MHVDLIRCRVNVMSVVTKAPDIQLTHLLFVYQTFININI